MSLQMQDHEAFQRREWRVERIAWPVAGAVLAAAVLGLLGGPGPLSWTTARSLQGDVQVEFQRFAHREADDVVTISVAGTLVDEDTVPVEVSSAWLSAVDVDGISPEPQEQVAAGDVVRLVFAAQRGSGLTIDVSYRPDELWRQRGEVRVGGQSAPFTQFVYP